MNKTFDTRKVTLSDSALRVIPTAMLEHINAGGSIWLVETPADGRAFISVSENPTGRICTFVNENDIMPAQTDDPRDISFIKPGALVWFVHPACEDEPIRQGEVEQVYPDGSVLISDNYLGDLDTDCNSVFKTRAEAEAHFATMA